MILLAESPGPAFVAGHTAFETLGPVIEHVGTPAFVAALGQFTRRFAAFDSLHVLRLTPQHGTSGKPRAEWFGSHVDVCEQDHQRDIMRLYMHRFAERDPVMTRVPAPDSVEVIQRSAAGTNDRELCEAIFEPRQFREECVLLKTVSGAHYSISLSRSRRMPSFSLSEMARIRLLGDVLLPLAALHAQQVTGPGPSHRHADVPDLLTARLAQIGAALSERERAVCAALVRGDTYAAIAEAMEIRKSSVETYARRALVKLGVSSRRDLLAWLHETG
ncbi:hypothetical protein R69888_01455 [Paraburkholderia haematera]|uniref:HTH luxR-type domain-containing protein n=2 Tax=Paraburkholderia haematera TaxID=2793077 RepID=A0ABN7KWU0_9BURK|nr:hypothetical protein R69888_01455 [Paraburkholderia haematera]